MADLGDKLFKKIKSFQPISSGLRLLDIHVISSLTDKMQLMDLIVPIQTCFQNARKCILLFNNNMKKSCLLFKDKVPCLSVGFERIYLYMLKYAQIKD